MTYLIVYITYIKLSGVNSMRNNQERTCLKCEDKMIKCYVADGLQGLLVKNPDGNGLFSNKKNTKINPFICTNCGFAEWYAEKPEDLI